jgi:hypothetical protein
MRFIVRADEKLSAFLESPPAAAAGGPAPTKSNPGDMGKEPT